MSVNLGVFIVCMRCACVSVCVYVSMCVYLQIYVCMYVCVCVYIYSCIYIYIYIYIYIFDIYIYTHTHIHTYIYTSIHNTRIYMDKEACTHMSCHALSVWHFIFIKNDSTCLRRLHIHLLMYSVQKTKNAHRNKSDNARACMQTPTARTVLQRKRMRC